MAQFDFQMGTAPPEGGPLSEEDLLRQERDLDPDEIIRQHTDRQNAAQEQIAQQNMERIRQEQQQLATRLEQERANNQALQNQYSHLKGQMDALSTMQRAAPDKDEDAYTEEELQIHGDAKDFVSKTARIELNRQKQALREEIRKEFENELAALRSEVNKTQTVVDSNHRTLKQQFKSDLERMAASYGLDTRKLANDSAFLAWCQRPFAPGDSTPWGQRLEQNIEAQNLDSSLAMLKQYADYLKPDQSAEQYQVPASSGVRSTNSAASANLSLREKLIAKVESMQSDFIAGRYPGSQEDYQREKAKLIEKIDDIPTLT